MILCFLCISSVATKGEVTESEDQLNQHGAGVLANLIRCGLATDPPESLPPEWRAAYGTIRIWGIPEQSPVFLDIPPPCTTDCHFHDQLISDEHITLAQLWERVAAQPPGEGVFTITASASHSFPATWLLPCLFPRPGLNFILGPLGSKKTWLALDLAVSVALGRGWLGYPCPATPSVFIDEEIGLANLWQRVRSVLLAYHAPPHTPFHFSSAGHYDLADAHDIDSLLSQALSIKAGLIVIDMPFSFSLDLEKHNLHARVPALVNLQALSRAANAAVLVLHHTKKRRTALGSALIASGVDHVLAVDSSYGQPLIHLHTIASKDLAPISITAQICFRGDLFSLSPSVAHPPTPLGVAGFDLLRYLHSRELATTAQLIAAVSSAVPTRVRTLIHELASDGYIRRADPGGRGSRATYQLTPAGRRLV